MSKLGMGNCFPFIKTKHQKGNKDVSIAILGLDNAGKTTAARSIQGGPLDDIAPTVGFDNLQFSVGKFNVNLYDLGGGKNIRGIWPNYLCEIYGLIYVIDSSDAARMEEARDNLHGLFSNDKVRGKPVLLLANKQDEESALDEGEIVEILNLVNIVNENEIPCLIERCIAKIGVGKKMDRAIKHGLRWLLGYIEDHWEQLHGRIATEMEVQRKAQEEEKARRRERVTEIRRQRELERQARGEELPEEPVLGEGENPFKKLTMADVKKKEAAEKERKRIARAAEAAAAAAAVPQPAESDPAAPVEPSATRGLSETTDSSAALGEPSPSSLRPSDPLPPPVLAGSAVRGQFYSPRGPNSGPEENSGDFLRPLKPSMLPPLEPSGAEAGEEKKKKKKKKGRLGRKNRLAPDPVSGDGDDAEEGGGMGSRTPSRPDLFITEQIFTVDELDEEELNDSGTGRLGANASSGLVAT